MKLRLHAFAQMLPLLMLGANACAGVERSAADCVNDATIKLGEGPGSKLSATCDVPEEIVLIAMPAASRPASEPDHIPKEIRVLVTQSREVKATTGARFHEMNCPRSSQRVVQRSFVMNAVACSRSLRTIP
jgi:hypothetical protein